MRDAIRWVFSIFRLFREPPPRREIPIVLLKCATFGALTGPLSAVFFTSLSNPRMVPLLLTTPMAILGTMVTGIIFSLSFYICCGLGNAWLHPIVGGYPPGIARTTYVLYNAVASSFAFFIAAGISTRLPFGNVHIVVPYLWQILVFEAILGAVLALVIGAFIKLKCQIEEANADIHEKELMQGRLAAQTARAQALALQSQINPHFFFNTLNTISALIEDDPRSAQRMIGRLADMFRYTLGCTHTEAVALEQELQFVRDYLAIEQARFPSRLRVELPEGPLPNLRVPGLVLQPLVENAVKYGIAPLLGGGTVSVQVTEMNGTARVSVRNTADDCADLAPLALFRPGHALENVRARLRLFTGQAEPLRFVNDGEWTEFSFEMATAGLRGVQ